MSSLLTPQPAERVHITYAATEVIEVHSSVTGAAEVLPEVGDGRVVVFIHDLG